jgi:hypothetical protein
MIPPIPELAELQTLLDALCEESITPDQVRRLEELVRTHPAAEAYYVQYLSFYADLVGHFGVLPAPTTGALRERLAAAQSAGETASPPHGLVVHQDSPPLRRSRRWLWAPLSLSGLAASVLVVWALWQRPHHPSTFANPAPEAVDDTVAVLLQAPEAVWGDTDQPLRAGNPLAPGWLRLKSGFAHIEFYNGATVILEGPADFKLISRTEAYCARGKLRALVPPQAVGFRIGSPKLDLVDRGTEFGLQVDEGDKTEVHVFKGKVELHDPGSAPKAAPQEMTTGQGVRLEGPGMVRPIALNPTAFLTAQDLARRSEQERDRRQRAWLAASAALRRDPDLRVYYPFEADQPWSRTLLDQAQGRRQAQDGAIVGCSWVTGRWPGKQGLEFKRVSDRVRFRVPGTFDSITLMAWVRVDGLPNRNNSLMMVDGWGVGGLHWQIGEDGTLILGVKAPPNMRNAHYHAPGVLTRDRLGQWLHLAVVYDRDGHQVTQYVDGRAVVHQPIPFDIPLKIGDAELGNWNIAPGRSRQPIRYLSGCMDEFMIFSRALNAQEITTFYHQGRPPL